MATFAFCGLDNQAAVTDDVRITLDGIDPPLELPQLLEPVPASAQRDGR
jgi:hypothetical protein